jgi:hypothetical protein
LLFLKVTDDRDASINFVSLRSANSNDALSATDQVRSAPFKFARLKFELFNIVPAN